MEKTFFKQQHFWICVVVYLEFSCFYAFLTLLVASWLINFSCVFFNVSSYFRISLFLKFGLFLRKYSVCKISTDCKESFRLSNPPSQWNYSFCFFHKVCFFGRFHQCSYIVIRLEKKWQETHFSGFFINVVTLLDLKRYLRNLFFRLYSMM